jgi:hypothetical protein
LENFIFEIEKIIDVRLDLEVFNEDSMQKLAESLSLVQKNIKEKFDMSELNKAADVLNKLKDVRVVYLPPMTVASAFYTGQNPQEKAWKAINDFIKQSNLFFHKPDLRVFRIDHSNATGKNFGHEVWASIPDDFIVPEPLIKKKFHGGQYAAHVLGDDGFLTYLGMQDWINESEKYQYDYDGNLTRVTPPIDEIDSFGGTRLDPEEILNYPELYHNPNSEIQYDVLFPIKKDETIDDVPVEIPNSEEKCGFKALLVTKNKFKIMGFTKVMTSETNPDDFENELISDGRLDILSQYKKPGAPILGFGSMDMDSQIRGGWRWSICLQESDISDKEAFLKYNPYVRTIDASRWLIFEHKKGEPFDDHKICMKLGYTWNGTISGSFYVRPDGKLGKPDPNDRADCDSTVYCWYPVKYESGN